MTRAVRVFWIEPTGTAARSLRRYASNSSCSHEGNHGYHNAHAPIEDANVGGPDAIIREPGSDEFKLDPRWPTRCACGYEFKSEDEWQVFTERKYRRADTGEITTLRDAPPGAMYDAFWFEEFAKGPDGLHLVVKMPGGSEWMVDSQASNCDQKGRAHYCWVRHGDPRKGDIWVDKSGDTCGAGAGSILIHGTGYHGFLRKLDAGQAKQHGVEPGSYLVSC